MSFWKKLPLPFFNRQLSPRQERFVVTLLLLLFALQCFLSMPHHAPTWDEVGHLPAGYAYWKTGNFQLYPSNPPLIKLWAAAPLLFMDIKLDTSSEHWRRNREIEFGQLFLYETNDNSGTMFFWARLMIVSLGVMLGLLVFMWTKELFGKWPGVVALFLYSFNSNLIAHSHLTTSDIGFALFFFLAMYTFYRAITRPSWLRLLWSALAFGLAMSAKFTAIILLPIYFLIVILVLIFRPVQLKFPFRLKLVERYLHSEWLRNLAYSVAAALLFAAVAYVLIFINYGFHAEPLVRDADEQVKLEALLHKMPLGENATVVRTVSSLARAVPIPGRDYFTAFSVMMGFTPQVGSAAHSVSRSRFLMGKTSPDSFWYFPFAAFLFKTPAPLIILLLASAFFIRKPDWFKMLFLLIPIALTLLGTLQRPDFAYRYVILPLLPFFMVLIGKLISAPFMQRRFAQISLAVLLLWNAGSALAIHPHHLAYFNELAGGPSNGYKYMLDSNLDWGQDLPALKKYMDEHNIEKIKFSYAGTADPAYYGIRYDRLLGVDGYTFDPDFDQSRLPSCAPTDGVIAISATCLQNIRGFYPNASYDWLKQFQPDTVLGYSIFIYKIDRDSLATKFPQVQ
jgi:hypothetical protein